MKNRMKITTIVSGMFAILMLFSSTSLLPAVNAVNPQMTDDQIEAVHHAKLHKFPKPPVGIGCNVWTNETGWRSIACVSPPDLPHPAEGGLSNPLYGQSTNVNSVSFGEVETSFFKYSGESDSSAGSGAFSIQVNTNPYTLNGVSYETQFVEMNPSNGAGMNCVWQVDITNHLYPNICSSTAPSHQTLSSTYDAYEEGYIDGSGNLVAEFCSYQQNTCWSASTTDNHSLSTHWSKVNGNILGYGSSSNAVFTSPTTEYTYTTIFSSATYTVSTATYFSTLETNNLTYQSELQGGCTSNNCELTTKSTN